MSILIIGDPHFKEENKRETDQLVDDCICVIKNQNPDFAVILGDVYEDGEYVYYGCILRVYEMIMQFSRLIPIYILIGNHDRPNNRVYLTNEHPFNEYKNLHNVTIIDRCFTMEWREKKICMMPYVPNGMFHKACEDCGISIKDFDLFFSHQEFKGCSINLLTKSECDEWKSEYPMNVSGHIHKKEMLGNNLFYPGTPFQHKFGDDEDKGIYLMDSNFNFQKIEIRIPKKAHLKLKHTELDSVEIDPNYDLKVTITGPIDIVRDLLKRSDLKEKFRNAKIQFKDNTKIRKAKKDVVINTPFEVRLKNYLNDEKKISIFRMLYPDY